MRATIRANAIGKHESQRHWYSCWLRSVRMLCSRLKLSDCVSLYLLREFVYVFRREAEKTQVSRLCCMQRAFRNSAYVRRIQPRRLTDLCLFCLASENVSKFAQQIQANAIGKHEGQRHSHSYSLRSMRIPCSRLKLSTHLFTFFRGESEREPRQKRHRSDSRLCCMQRAFRNSAYVHRIQPRLLSDLCLFCLALPHSRL